MRYPGASSLAGARPGGAISSTAARSPYTVRGGISALTVSSTVHPQMVGTYPGGFGRRGIFKPLSERCCW